MTNRGFFTLLTVFTTSLISNSAYTTYPSIYDCDNSNSIVNASANIAKCSHGYLETEHQGNFYWNINQQFEQVDKKYLSIVDIKDMLESKYKIRTPTLIETDFIKLKISKEPFKLALAVDAVILARDHAQNKMVKPKILQRFYDMCVRNNSNQHQ